MVTKAEFVKALDELPDDATIDDAVERLVFMLAVAHGLAQADAGGSDRARGNRRTRQTWLN